jgi:prepilin-type N-terminal cleavage/methylation domain-containing protein
MSRFNKKLVSGFTLMELLVSISISVVILGVVIHNQNKYSSASSLSNMAQSIAADLALAQTYGVSVKQATTNNFNTAYGLHFRTGTGGNATAVADYIFFADLDKDGAYDGGTGSWGTTNPNCPTATPTPTDECLKRIRMNSGILFGGLGGVLPFCYIPSNGGPCVARTGTLAVTDIHRMDIVFTRPQSKATFKFYNSGNSPLNVAHQGVGIRVRDNANHLKWICVYQTGQISVQDAIC